MSCCFQKCSAPFLLLLQTVQYTNHDERKYFLLPINRLQPLTVVTLGIGKDVDAETKFKKDFSQTKFYGVDLDDEVSGKMYQDILGGKFLKGLVGAKEGKYEASIMINGKYESAQEDHYSLQQALQKFNIKDKIDLLLMDIEGAEFELIPDIFFHPEKYPVICQINVEFHSPKGYTNMIQVYHNASIDGRYMYSSMINDYLDFHRSYFINVKDKYCLDTYFSL